MPELLTHVAVGWSAGRLLRRFHPPLDLFYVACGACLPDWLSHFYVLWPESFDGFSMLHEPIPFLLACALLSTFAARSTRVPIFGSLVLGASSHYLIDFFQIHVTGRCYPLFPFSCYHTGIFIYPVEGSLYVAPWLVPIACLGWYGRRVWQRRRERTPVGRSTPAGAPDPRATGGQGARRAGSPRPWGDP